MKQAAIIRIVAWSVLAVFLTAFLISGITRGFSSFSFDFGSVFNYQDSSKYSIAEGTVNAGQVQTIEINWVSGGVRIEAYDGDDVIFSETSNKSLDENSKMRYDLRDKNLIIQFCAPHRIFPSLNNLSKDLTLLVPYDHPLAALDLESVSADVEVTGITAAEMDVESVSGPVMLRDLTSEDLDIEMVSGRLTMEGAEVVSLTAESVSGKMELAGAFGDVDCTTVSGNLTVAPGSGVSRLEAETVSGKAQIELPDEIDGFTLKHSSVSGSVSCDFPAQSGKNTLTYQSGRAVLDIETVSGSISVVKQ